VNQDLAKELLKQDPSLVTSLGREDGETAKKILSNPMKDDRFGSLFTNPVCTSSIHMTHTRVLAWSWFLYQI
jgi:UDP-N-acetylenolpyruvoylglucosamine reductase